MKFDTIMLDESSMIQNETTKRTKAILKLKTDNVILLSGTPTGGKYERLVTQMNLIGWNISENTFWNQYVEWHWNEVFEGKKIKAVDGYKNEERLKRKMRQHGCHFLKTEEVVDLPNQTNQYIKVDPTKEYKQFRKHSYVIADGEELIGDTVLTKILYERQLCGQYNVDKFKAFVDLALSTEDRLIVFYNFNAELNELLKINLEYLDRPASIVSGSIKDLSAYESESDSITFIQYQAGAKGLNLQKANRMIFFTPTLSTEDYMQAKKRIHRIGQNKPCFYYHLVCKNSIEEKIYHNISRGVDYTERLFLEDVHGI
jgi:SNF2 family DNA or RNA helicase